MCGVLRVPARIPDDEREQIIAAFATGKSCKQIARDFERSPDTISRIARAAGHKFGRMNLDNARAARKAYGAEWRANAREKLSEEITQTLAEMRSEYLVYAFGGKDNVYNEQTIPKPDARAQRDMAATITSLWRVVREMDEYESKQADLAQLEVIFRHVDRMADDYESTVEPETSVEHQPE